MSKETKIEIKSLTIEGRNAVLEAFRSGKPVDKLFVLDGCQDGPVRTIVREAKKARYDLKFRFEGKVGSAVRNREASGSHCACSGL